MSRKKAIFFLVSLLLIASIVAAFKFWPKKYTVGTALRQTIVFWDNREAFVFLSLHTTGRAENVLQEKLAGTRYGYLSLLVGNYIDFSKQEVVAYHLAADGQLDRYSLPDNTVLYGSWGLEDGRIELTQLASSSETAPTEKLLGFRWDGAQFIPVSSPPKPANVAAQTQLSADDDDDDEYTDSFLNQTSRQQFKAAGWHYKVLTGYEAGGAAATLPITLDGNNFNLTIESTTAKDAVAKFDFLLLGAKSLRLSGGNLRSGSERLWSQTGWQTITKSEYESLRQKYGRQGYRRPFAWTTLIILALLVLWRFAGWFHLLFAFGTMKRRVLKNMATSFSFPPATPGQFPALDIEALDRYSRELEGMGFTRLLDFSLVSDSPTNPPSFCRLLAHTRHHCFGIVSQMFPRGKTPLPLRCSFEGCLQDGWTLAFSNGKPQATSSLLRRRKALGVSMPGVTGSELLQAFLKMREQVCLDLGISPVNDDTLQAFINKTQRAASEIREAVQAKNFVKGLPEIYLRKFSLLKTKPEYVWLGDYPKEAERRKQGLSNFAAASQ